MPLAEKLNYTKTQINKLKELTGETVLSSVVDNIKQNYGKSETTANEWKPEPDWWDIEKILEEDTEDYAQKVICLLTDELDDKATTNSVNGAEKYKLSDGQTIDGAGGAKNISNIFNTAQDKICSKGYKTRYIIFYSNANFGTIFMLPKNAIYTVFSGVKFSGKPFQGKNLLQAVKFIKNSSCTRTDAGSMFESCYNLQKIVGLDTSGMTNMSNMFSSCYSLKEIPFLNTENVTNMSNMFNRCYNIKEIPYLDTSKVTNMSSMFNGCCNLNKITNLDMKSVTNTNNMFLNCSSLIDIQNIQNVQNINSFGNSSYFNHATLLRLLKALVDLIGQTTQKLIVGSVNLAKLTEEEKAIPIEKNWTLA